MTDRTASIFMVFAAFIFMLLMFTFCAHIEAHEAYPYECCKDQHCHPVPCSEIRLIDGLYHWNKYTIPASRIRLDLPGCHVCIYNDALICIFVEGDS